MPKKFRSLLHKLNTIFQTKPSIYHFLLNRRMEPVVPLYTALAWYLDASSQAIVGAHLVNNQDSLADLVSRLSYTLRDRLPCRPTLTTTGAQVRTSLKTFLSSREWGLLTSGVQDIHVRGRPPKLTHTLTVDSISSGNAALRALLSVQRTFRTGVASTPKQLTLLWHSWKQVHTPNHLVPRSVVITLVVIWTLLRHGHNFNPGNHTRNDTETASHSRSHMETASSCPQLVPW